MKKESLDSRSRLDLVKYRLQRAKETLGEAQCLADGQYFNAAVNRLYYACYYAAAALMLSNSMDVSTHSGIKSMLGLKFIVPGLLEPEYGRIYQLLFENRQSGDYEDFIYCDSNLYGYLRPQAENFVDRILRMVTGNVNHREILK